MLETDSLILDKAKFSDWKEMYHNVWSHPESAKYMFWRVTPSEKEAQVRIKKTIEFQKNHASIKLADSLGFVAVAKDLKTDDRNGQNYNLIRYSLNLQN